MSRFVGEVDAPLLLLALSTGLVVAYRAARVASADVSDTAGGAKRGSFADDVVFRREECARACLPLVYSVKQKGSRGSKVKEAAGKVAPTVQHVGPRVLVPIPLLLDADGGGPTCGVMLLGGAPALLTCAASGTTWHRFPPDAMLMGGCRMNVQGLA